MTRTAIAAVIAAIPLWGTALPDGGARGANVHRDVESALRALPPTGEMTVIVRLREQADLRGFRFLSRGQRRAAVVGALRARSESGQAGVRAQLHAEEVLGRVSRVQPFWVFNGLSVTGSRDAIRALAARADVAEISSDDILIVPAALPAGAAEPNVAAIGAPDLWSLGHLGQGVVIATLDSGVDVSHPDLASRYRGGSNSWFDPYGQHTTPYDRTGHGTWTTGVLVGGDAGGTSIGVAPQATFIAARIWNDRGSATATAIHKAFQWVLDPDGDPGTADAPDIVSNSWAFGAPGCNLEFQPDLQALRSAGIVPVFAAGNYGPGSQTSVSPANYPEALSVGAVDGGNAIAIDSSRGPSACGGAVFPSVVAPGVNVWTTDLYSTYSAVSGTSIAAPHVAGLLALLLEAYPGTSTAQAEAAVIASARDLGIAGPDNDFGHGIVDGMAAYRSLATAPPPAPIAVADAFTVPGDVATTVTAPGILANDQDPGGNPLSASLTSGPTHGTLSLQPSGGFTYTPTSGFSGTDGFGYRVSNGTAESEAAIVTLNVMTTAPTAAGESYLVAENGTLTVPAPGVLGNDSDPAGLPLSAILVAPPLHGTVSLQASGGFTYVPQPSYYGADAFTYRAANGGTESAPATVSLTVTFANQPPVARDDAASTPRGKSVTIPVLVNDSDVDGSIVPGTVTIASAPRNGSASKRSDGTVSYTPKRRYVGTDSFTYTVKDDNGATSNTATVTVQVR